MFQWFFDSIEILLNYSGNVVVQVLFVLKKSLNFFHSFHGLYDQFNWLCFALYECLPIWVMFVLFFFSFFSASYLVHVWKLEYFNLLVLWIITIIDLIHSVLWICLFLCLISSSYLDMYICLNDIAPTKSLTHFVIQLFLFISESFMLWYKDVVLTTSLIFLLIMIDFVGFCTFFVQKPTKCTIFYQLVDDLYELEAVIMSFLLEILQKKIYSCFIWLFLMWNIYTQYMFHFHLLQVLSCDISCVSLVVEQEPNLRKWARTKM